mmetsp:Transcript_3202/g.3829  ORF Transcript_3202/g.3829 Transcript_3202/m.3829 type:complete len:225 (+) Transcript_3202:278-952(+)
MTVYCTCQNKSSTKTLITKTIARIEKGGSYYQIIELIADYTDTYVIEIKCRYRSEYFNEQLRKWEIDSMSPSQKSKYQSKDNYRIDYAKKEVIRNFNKKFKFQTRSPFTVSPNIIVKKNKYFMEMTLENEGAQLFLQSVTLKVTNPNLDCADLNSKDEEDEVVGSVMKKKEIRSYIYIFELKEGNKINKGENVGIGTVEIRWQNTFGDIGCIEFGPFIYMNESD